MRPDPRPEPAESGWMNESTQFTLEELMRAQIPRRLP